MAPCHQATSHYTGQCWPTPMSPYGVTRPQWLWFQLIIMCLKSQLLHDKLSNIFLWCRYQSNQYLINLYDIVSADQGSTNWDGDIFQMTFQMYFFYDQNVLFLIKISLEYILRSPFAKKSALALIMAWPLSEPLTTLFIDAYMCPLTLLGSGFISRFHKYMTSLLSNGHILAHQCVKDHYIHWFKQQFVACSMPWHYLNLHWLIENRTPIWNLTQKKNIHV